MRSTCYAVLAIVLVGVNWSCNKSADPNKAPDNTPIIYNLSATMGEVGKVISISGANFSVTASENTVTFNGTPATISTANTDLLMVTVPAGATSGPVVVAVKGLSVTGPSFTVYVAGTITGISPICGPVGTVITITGTGFETDPANLQIFFNPVLLVRSSTLSASATQITVAAPSLPASTGGTVIVKAFGTEPLHVQGENDPSNYWLGNPNNSGSPVDFTIQPFTVTDFSPASGSRNSSVVINGKDFSTDLTAYSVFFMKSSSIITQAVVTNATSTQLTVTVPGDAVTGPIAIGLAANNVGFCNSHQAFTVTP